MASLTDRNLYELLGIEKSAPDSEIRKAYRKKALSCHPDKNPDNPRAAELFHELTGALEILTDVAARAAYDKVLNARERTKLRVKELDAKRKKLKEDLEAREDAYRRSTDVANSSVTDEERFKAEVERLRKEGSRQVEEEIALVTKRISEELRAKREKDGLGEKQGSSDGSNSYRLKIKWKIDKNQSSCTMYDRDSLYRIFSKYGHIVAMVVSPVGKSRAIIEFDSQTDAEVAANTETGYPSSPLVIEKLWSNRTKSFEEKEKSPKFFSTATDDQPKSTWQNVPPATATSHRVNAASSSVSDVSEKRKFSDADFEELVLANLRKAQEKKRLAASTETAENR